MNLQARRFMGSFAGTPSFTQNSTENDLRSLAPPQSATTKGKSLLFKSARSAGHAREKIPRRNHTCVAEFARRDSSPGDSPHLAFSAPPRRNHTCVAEFARRDSFLADFPRSRDFLGGEFLSSVVVKSRAGPAGVEAKAGR